MGEHITIEGKDGFELGAYLARPKEMRRGRSSYSRDIWGERTH